MNEIVSILQGDITQQSVDAIVNAANTRLCGGGGVDGAIHRYAGPELLKECLSVGGCPTGEARITQGYNLPAKWIIHTAGPIWRGGGAHEEELLARCYQSCFNLAEGKNIRSIAFPSISTGAYRFPLERATYIALRETMNFLESKVLVKKIIFVCFDEKTFSCYKRIEKEM
ncbi:O-acetyl-ADP-ribose deacetylase [Candidatus Omnitrophota bacterium]